MELENVIEKIKDMEQNIFEYNISTIISDLIFIIDEIYNFMKKLNEYGINIMNQVLNGLTIALENKDYLLLADLLFYELKPMILTTDKE
ncbi:hypothetical protein [Clostridium tagluense]|uniref:hypothetical protein n=1 Tax=Clostridium tagluense TaxID=360422 RepID=UPI001CF1EA54|nr:hypothetical protein [Clostridium tagluense]MCB2297191.1 hypothetical protein [Clostridium tagluense]